MGNELIKRLRIMGDPDNGIVDHRTIREAADALEQASRAVVPSVAVPDEPTMEMREAGNRALDMLKAEPGMGIADRAYYVYRAMLAAAPAPQPGAEGRVGELCHNCATALPEGCKGIFRNDGDACALNRAAIAKGGEEGK